MHSYDTWIRLGSGVSVSDTYGIWIRLGYAFSRIPKRWIRIGSDTCIRHVWDMYLRGKPWEERDERVRGGSAAARGLDGGGMRMEELGAVED